MVIKALYDNMIIDNNYIKASYKYIHCDYVKHSYLVEFIVTEYNPSVKMYAAPPKIVALFFSNWQRSSTTWNGCSDLKIREHAPPLPAEICTQNK